MLLKPEIALERQLSVRNTMKGVWAEQRNVFLTNCHIFVHFCDTLIFQDYEKKGGLRRIFMLISVNCRIFAQNGKIS